MFNTNNAEGACTFLVDYLSAFVGQDAWDEHSVRSYLKLLYKTFEDDRFLIPYDCAEKLIKLNKHIGALILIAGDAYNQTNTLQRVYENAITPIKDWRAMLESIHKHGKLPHSDPRIPIAVTQEKLDKARIRVRDAMLKTLVLTLPGGVSSGDDGSPSAKGFMTDGFTISELLHEVPLYTNFLFTSTLLHYPFALSSMHGFRHLYQHMHNYRVRHVDFRCRRFSWSLVYMSVCFLCKCSLV